MIMFLDLDGFTSFAEREYSLMRSRSSSSTSVRSPWKNTAAGGELRRQFIGDGIMATGTRLCSPPTMRCAPANAP